ncbi:hypothetical protein Tco_1328785 [Tanacetum coccineum]
MITYLKHMGKYTHNQLKSKSFEEIQKLYKKEQKWINDFVPMSDDSGKKDDRSSKQAESNRSSKNYKIFSEMLDEFDKQDVMDLHRLVKERYDTTSPEGYDLLFWGDLMTLFEPFHVLLMDNGIAIHMMIEKKYSLTQEMLSRMLNRRLEVDHESEMAFEEDTAYLYLYSPKTTKETRSNTLYPGKAIRRIQAIWE